MIILAAETALLSHLGSVLLHSNIFYLVASLPWTWWLQRVRNAWACLFLFFSSDSEDEVSHSLRTPDHSVVKNWIQLHGVLHTARVGAVDVNDDKIEKLIANGSSIKVLHELLLIHSGIPLFLFSFPFISFFRFLTAGRCLWVLTATRTCSLEVTPLSLVGRIMLHSARAPQWFRTISMNWM